MARANPKDIVREIKISNLLEVGKLYRLPANKDGTYTEDPNGTLKPTRAHCWVSWVRVVRPIEGDVYGSNEAECFNSLEEANAYVETLKGQLEKTN